MSQEYQHACERAELLGLPAPNEEEWLAENAHRKTDETEYDENAIAQDLDQSDESAKHIGGGLDELNSILSSTQKKINRFKTVCGSLGTMLKIRRGSRPSTPKHVTKGDNTNTTILTKKDEFTNDLESRSAHNSEESNSEQTPIIPHTKIDINQKMGSHLDKLDSLITKAENAQFSMQHQTKQMRRIVK